MSCEKVCGCDALATGNMWRAVCVFSSLLVIRNASIAVLNWRVSGSAWLVHATCRTGAARRSLYNLSSSYSKANHLSVHQARAITQLATESHQKLLTKLLTAMRKRTSYLTPNFVTHPHQSARPNNAGPAGEVCSNCMGGWGSHVYTLSPCEAQEYTTHDDPLASKAGQCVLYKWLCVYYLRPPTTNTTATHPQNCHAAPQARTHTHTHPSLHNGATTITTDALIRQIKCQAQGKHP
jgi:hypothetical protein